MSMLHVHTVCPRCLSMLHRAVQMTINDNLLSYLTANPLILC
jgi:hypothetical protein